MLPPLFGFSFFFLRVESFLSTISKVWENSDLCGVAAQSTKTKKEPREGVFPPQYYFSLFHDNFKLHFERHLLSSFCLCIVPSFCNTVSELL